MKKSSFTDKRFGGYCKLLQAQINVSYAIVNLCKPLIRWIQ